MLLFVLVVTLVLKPFPLLLAPEEATAIRRDLDEATKALVDAEQAKRAAKDELDTLTMAKHDLEASVQKEQEECSTLRGELQGS